jgi:hypothetical protein
MQRRACRALQHVAYGRSQALRNFGRGMAKRASRDDWQSIELTPRQLERIARTVRRYRRQITNPNLLFWAQRTLAEGLFQTLEES